MRWRIGFLWTNHDDAQEICNSFQRMGARFIDQGHAELLDENNNFTGLYIVVLTFESTKQKFFNIYHALSSVDEKWVLEDLFDLPGMVARDKG